MYILECNDKTLIFIVEELQSKIFMKKIAIFFLARKDDDGISYKPSYKTYS